MPKAPRASKPRRPSWDDLEAFLAVCRAGTLSEAARVLEVDHSTVLRRVGALESCLSTRLFDRLPSGYALTAPGAAFSEKLAGVSEQVEAAHRHVLGLDEAVSGLVRVTTTDSGLALLTPHIAAFAKLHPRIEVHMSINNSLLNLTQREADVALRGSNKPPENLVGRQVGRLQFALYASKAYLKSLGCEQPTLDQLRFVGPDDSLSQAPSSKWFVSQVHAIQVALRVDSMTGMVDAVAEGVGAGMLLCPLAQARKELVCLAPPDPKLDAQVWLLTHPSLRNVARIRVFTQFIAERLLQDPRLGH
jgi:DNA-binding transcriptional LysR family regulator